MAKLKAKLPKYIQTIQIIYSTCVLAKMSPKPTVVTVYTAQ